jgi:hypothetical protein
VANLHEMTASLQIPPLVTIQGHLIPSKKLYPISRDHLLPLIEYNLWRGMLTNIQITGHLHFLERPSCRFSGQISAFPNPFAESKTLPASFHPTELQKQTPVYPEWINLIPSPRMRDNALRTHTRFSNLEMCADLLSGMNGARPSAARMLVWSNPWEARGWEMTQGFMRKWWFLVEGCDDLLDATNHWRGLRGEEPLVWDVK